ncbi:MAG: hypothetical protein M3R11_08315, partial [Acidobacteriota bacterium]|nr:hypothetical protein [Acidobacteriota bacterium]
MSLLIYGLILLTIVAATESAASAQATTSQPATDKTQKVDRSRLEVIEELSESLANDLLELSVAARDRDQQLTAEFFPFEIVAKPFPSRPATTKNQVKWIGAHDWEVKETPALKASTGANKITKKAFLNNWSEFLAHFSEIEDARFKVKEANFDETAKAVLGAEQPTAVVGATGRARIAFYVIGRDTDGRREWARGTFWANVRFDKNKHWQFDSFDLIGFDSLVAEKDLFSEV